MSALYLCFVLFIEQSNQLLSFKRILQWFLIGEHQPIDSKTHYVKLGQLVKGIPAALPIQCSL